MSTEISRVRDASRERSSRRRFARSFTTVVVALAVAATALGAANAVRGPVVRDASINTVAAVERSGQRLVIEADQPVEAVGADAVRVTPAAEVEVESEGSRITVRFASVLRYADSYTIEVDVTGTATGARSTLRHVFATPDVDVYTLVRGPSDDRILRASLHGTGAEEAVASAPHIQEYAVARGFVVYVTADADGLPALALRAPGDPLPYPMPTPAATGIHSLHAARDALLVGYLADDPAGESTLQIVDLESTAWEPRVVLDADGSPLSVRDWLWVPGTSSVVAQTADRQLFVIDVLGDAPPQLLGAHAELRGFVPGAVELVVADPEGGSTIDLTTSDAQPLALPPADVDPELYPVGFIATSTTSSIEAYSDLLGDAAAPRAAVYVIDGSGTRELFRPATATSRTGAICLSPNGQYLAVEVIPGGAVSDNDPHLPGWSDTTSYFVDVLTGDASRGLPGMQAVWCR